MADVKQRLRKLVSPERALEFKIKALAATLERTGVPKEQALILARQRLTKEEKIVEAPVPTQAGLFTPTNMLLIGVIVLGVVYFMNPGGKR